MSGIKGGEVLNALMACGERAKAIGYTAAIEELGIDQGELFEACRREARDWVDRMSTRPTVGDVAALVQSAEIHGVLAGFRLGQLYGGDVPEESPQRCEDHGAIDCPLCTTDGRA